MPSKLELAGQKFGRLTVISEAPAHRFPNGKPGRKWECQCECGNQITVFQQSLTQNLTKSCGCYNIDSHTKHGHNPSSKSSPTYNSWQSMKLRCNNSNKDNYDDYGGKGITYDPAWEDFKNFLSDMGERPPGTTLDRINVNSNYCKSNCRWATDIEQQNNKRNNKLITYQGKTQSQAQWNRELGFPKNLLGKRLTKGWSIEKAFTTPVKNKETLITFKGKTQNLTAWAKELGINQPTLSHRLYKHNWSVEKAFTTPVATRKKVASPVVAEAA